MSAIFGSPSKESSTGSQQSTSNSTSNSSSGNLAYPALSNALGGQTTNATSASNDLSALLGVGGDASAQQAAFKNFQNSTGYQFGLDQGSQAVTQNAATKGLLNSGSTAKGLETYGQNYANTQYQNYLNPLQSLVSSGNQAGSVIGSTGGVSNSNSVSNSQSTGTNSSSGTGAKQGIGGMLGALM